MISFVLVIVLDCPSRGITPPGCLVNDFKGEKQLVCHKINVGDLVLYIEGVKVSSKCLCYTIDTCVSTVHGFD